MNLEKKLEQLIGILNNLHWDLDSIGSTVDNLGEELEGVYNDVKKTLAETRAQAAKEATEKKAPKEYRAKCPFHFDDSSLSYSVAEFFQDRPGERLRFVCEDCKAVFYLEKDHPAVHQITP